jgi:hypothetical protein
MSSPGVCPKKKCGEYNMLKCARADGHDGDCIWVVDHARDAELEGARMADDHWCQVCGRRGFRFTCPTCERE